MSWIGIGSAAVGAGASLYSSYQQGKTQEDAMRGMSVNMPNYGTTLGGGMTSDIVTRDGYQRLITDLGDLDPARASLAGVARQGSAGAYNAGMTAQPILGAMRGTMNDPYRGLLDMQAQGALGQYGSSLGALNTLGGQGFQRGFQDQAYGGALQALTGAMGAGNQQRDATLDLLRQQAQPFEDRAFQSLRENQFKTGQMGTSGGGLQTEAFARGLGQADLSRQLAAGQEGRAVTAGQLQAAQGMAGLGGQARGLEEQLMQGAFGRFGDLQALLGGIGQSSQQRGMADVDMLTRMATLTPQLQSAYLAPSLQALQGGAGLQTQGLEPFLAGLELSKAEANARVGAGTNAASMARAFPDYGRSAGADALAGIAGAASRSVGDGGGMDWSKFMSGS